MGIQKVHPWVSRMHFWVLCVGFLNQLEGLHLVEEELFVGVFHRAEREAVYLVDHTHSGEGCLNRDRVRLDEEEVHDMAISVEYLASLGYVAHDRKLHHAREILREDISCDRDTAVAPQEVAQHRQVIVAAINAESVWAFSDKFCHSADISASLLDAYDILEVVSEADSHVGLDSRTCTTRDVVEDDRDIYSLSHGSEVVVHTSRSRLIIVRAYGKYGVYACVFSVLCIFDTALS